ncbi:pyridine nucleotide-disulfide oxidoreductase-domain-containing protein [Calycina marina]|uniref:Pyridine nucleotide-disulfide oxidoreductase-domain-containing protein n=1 Tax=Calycina marina TaxID=1763456 RepID=A0A9P8CIM1_9HELO|nr:pyridine nucleotide-disulfide oxidoreductase-domain-containing protein [Calycina marina]
MAARIRPNHSFFSIRSALFRGISTSQISRAQYPTRYEAVVVGAGPAGLAAVGYLLEEGKRPVLWVDERFHGGRLDGKYREVPANTKVKRFVSYADSTRAFKEITGSAKKPNAYEALRDADQESTSHISEAADMCIMLTEALNESKGVVKQTGRVTDAEWTEKAKWSVSVRSKDGKKKTKVISDLLVLCTGASPNSRPLPVDIEAIDLDYALSPTRLAKLISTSAKIEVGVIGASHSAILVLLNLYKLASTTHPSLRIKWFTRHPLRYAEERGSWIYRDNTGLKGFVATWARENLEPARLPSAPISAHLTKISTPKDPEGEKAAFSAHLANCTHVVQAIGYHADPIPELSIEGKNVDVRSDHEMGGFVDAEGGRVRGLYGLGIAFPERVTDPEGNVEFAVGLFKFVSYLGRVVKGWKA